VAWEGAHGGWVWVEALLDGDALTGRYRTYAVPVQGAEFVVPVPCRERRGTTQGGGGMDGA